MATTLLPESRNPNVSFPVNTIVLKDRQVGGDLQSRNLRINSVVENNNQGGEPGHKYVEHSSSYLMGCQSNIAMTFTLNRSGGMRSHRMTG
ncbi:unnamed protein product [Linum trigynum]|uniref:Uncharacterized protein n=1 Tax=Linum trigynum TaxID=586398 RepID=A0AAV2DBG6_9ROSI